MRNEFSMQDDLPNRNQSMAARQTGDLSPKAHVYWHYLLATILFIVAIAPFFLCSPLPLADYPNHLARMYILSAIGHSPALQKYYEVHWQIIPDLTMDLIVPRMAWVMPVENAMLLFAILTFFLICVGVYSLHFSLYRRVSLSPIVVFLFLYNRQFIWGLLNYLFALGVALLTVAAWIRMRQSRPAARLVVFCLLIPFLFICHLSAFGVALVLICGFELQAAWSDQRKRRNVVLFSFLVLMATLLVIFIATPTGELWKHLQFDDVPGKLKASMDGVNNYNLPFDVASFLLISGVFLAGYASKKAEFKREMLFPVLALFLVFCVMPFGIFDTAGADRRLMIAIDFAIIGSTQWRFPSPLARRILFGGTLILFAMRMGVIAENWAKANKVYKSELAVMDHVPYGVRLAAAVATLDRPFPNNPPLTHLPNIAVLKKDVLVNSLFTKKGQQPVAYKNITEDVRFGPGQAFVVRNDLNQKFSPVNPYEKIPLGLYDYLLVINQQYFPYHVPETLSPVFASGNTTLYKIDIPD